MHKHAPLKTYSNRESKLMKLPWLTKGIQKSLKVRNKLYKKYLAKRDKFWYVKYKHYEKTIRRLARISKTKHYKEYFYNHLKNAKMIWSGINEIIHNKKSKDSDIFLDDNGNILTDQKKVANKFNLFYKNVASNLVEKLPKPNTKFREYLKNPNKNSMFLNETEPGEVFTLLNNQDKSKAADIYDISNKTWSSSTLHSPITNLQQIF